MRKILKLFQGIFLLLSLILMMNFSLADSFTADMLWKTEGKPDQNSKFFFMEHLYRYEITKGEQSIRFIVDRKARKTKVLNMGEKVYTEFPNKNFFILMSNPFEAHYAMLGIYKSTREGEETVDGLKCEKKALSMNGIVVQRVWISRKYNFPLRIINYKNGKQHMLVELLNIREVKLSTELFQPPPDFTFKQRPKR